MWPQRFNRQLLTPVAPGEVGARACVHTEALLRACRLGAGPATRPLLQPWRAPHIEWPYGVFHVADPEVARRACLQLDGTWALVDAPTGAARWRVRLAAQRADLSWWRPLSAPDAWDAGIVNAVSDLPAFRPRRASLLVLPHTAIDTAALAVLAGLENQARHWSRAVRLVVAGGSPPAFARAVAG